MHISISLSAWELCSATLTMLAGASRKDVKGCSPYSSASIPF